MKISDQRIVLTGAASGIGRALLERLAAYPARIVAADAQPERLVYPIATRTDFFEVAAGSCQPTHWPTQSPAHVAGAIVRGIEKDKAAIYPSRLFQLVLFLDRFLPLVRRVVTARDRRQLRRLREC
jgi:short-subunit dehydrogenase